MIKLFKIVLLLSTLGVVAGVLAFQSYATTHWRGSCGYLPIEHELTFLDSRGNRIEGVELKVEDERGNEYFCFPVTDHLPGQPPRSDRQGVMRFHHKANGIEWSDGGWELFWIFPITTKYPVYVCRFLHDGKELQRVRYAELQDRDWPEQSLEVASTVSRQWNLAAMMPDALRYQEKDTAESREARERQFFHLDTGPNLEGSIACRNARWLFEGIRAKQKHVENVEFTLIRRTIPILSK